jgi:hypothetical protein
VTEISPRVASAPDHLAGAEPSTQADAMTRLIVRLAAWLAVCASTVAAELPVIRTDADFESEIMASSHCWAVLFVSSTRDVAAAATLVERMGAALPALSLASADVDDVKAVCSEFNVRKRMVPRLLVFNSRARQASIVKLGEALTVDELVTAVRAELTENKEDADGRLEKLTLAIGSGKGEL